MIPVQPAPEPPSFDAGVRIPGLRAIAELSGKSFHPPRTSGRPFSKVSVTEGEIPPDKFPSYWTDALDDLMTAYQAVCAYSCFRIHPTTGAKSVDHFVPKSQDWKQVYEWSNYRLSSSIMNALKGEYTDVLDPFTIGEGWLQLEPVGYSVSANPALPSDVQSLIAQTIQRLRLNSAEMCRNREEDATRYLDGEVSLNILEQESPFVAFELRRMGMLSGAT